MKQVKMFQLLIGLIANTVNASKRSRTRKSAPHAKIAEVDANLVEHLGAVTDNTGLNN